MNQRLRFHELKMESLNLRPKPRISTGDGFYYYSNGCRFWISETLLEAVKIAVKDRTKIPLME